MDSDRTRTPAPQADDVSAVLAAASHDVRTPLNELLGQAQLLLRQELPREHVAAVTGMARAAEQVLGLVDGLLDYAALQSGRFKLEPATFDPRELVDAAVRELAQRGVAPGRRLSVKVEDSVPASLVADAARLRQLLVHSLASGLLRCAESAALVVTCAERSDGRLCLLLELRGLRAPAEPAPATPGLERSVCQRLAVLMSGQLLIDPAIGGDLLAGLVVGCERVQAAFGPDEEELAGLVLLLAHHDADALAELGRCAASWGCKAVAARDAASALTALRDVVHQGTPADLAVIDLDLPGTDGLELARRVRSDPLLAGMPLVLLEGVASGDRAAAAAGLFDARLPARADGPSLAACLAQLYRTPHAELLQRRRRSGAPAPARPAPVAAAAPATRAPGNVLVVEDVPSNALVARRMLEGAGLSVTTCSNGAEALQALAHKHFEIALVDCEMPVMDGYEATREIRRREQGSSRHQVVIALTANVMPGDRKRCLDAGMDDYVAKPLRADDLLRLIDEWLPWALAHRELERSGRT